MSADPEARTTNLPAGPRHDGQGAAIDEAGDPFHLGVHGKRVIFGGRELVFLRSLLGRRLHDLLEPLAGHELVEGETTLRR